RLTVEDQLRQIAESLRFDFLLVSNSNGAPLAGVVRIDNQLAAMDMKRTPPPQKGFFPLGDNTYQVNSFPVAVNDHNIGTLSIGERVGLGSFGPPTVLIHNGEVVRASNPGASPAEGGAALKQCGEKGECETRLAGETYLTLPSDSVRFGDDYSIRSLQSEEPV